MTDIYIYLIIALLPLTACMVIFQVNPYHALVIRGILGGVAAMLYAILGAADVALTEALVGTMLAITLYAIAVRSAMVMRVGVLTEELKQVDENILNEGKAQQLFSQLMTDLQKVFRQYHMRIELISYKDMDDLDRALVEQEIHTTCIRQAPLEQDDRDQAEIQPYQTKTRIKRLYNIMKNELSSSETILTYFNVANPEEKHS
ncbi:MAG: DUF4040 domain-containing protein [Xenococcaceae cyanobacterium MO_188.B32]|nr:DUF4040 domain-containing protein [Xenococcaceae cyanobacterium MO_188.B32]